VPFVYRGVTLVGYYTEIDVNLRVKGDKLEEFNKQLKILRDTGDNESWFSYYDDISITNDREIEFDEYNRKFYDADEFANWISEFVEKGYIDCYGEDSSLWRLEFDGCGNWNDMQSVIVYVPQDTLWKELTVRNTNGSPTVINIIDK
jgi:hypothetical protein